MAKRKYDSVSVLVVDDESLIRQLIKQILRNAGFSDIRDVDGAEEAWSAVQAKKPDIVICDIGMEPVSGVQFLQRVRASNSPEIKALPIVFLTVARERTTVMEAIKAGANGYLLKPISPSALLSRIDHVLSGKL